ncbi:MAG: hypothetical protein EOP02_00920 [Proteobacteria bacterium]|nr:MAG: hypothetical protein EOP02_00920 [Pseudomonadota bacterium]
MSVEIQQTCKVRCPSFAHYASSEETDAKQANALALGSSVLKKTFSKCYCGAKVNNTAASPQQPSRRGTRGGSTFAYRGARIECLPGNHVCGLFMAEHPLSGSSFGAPGTITPLVDLWIEKQQLPGYMRR